jgi:hypothetical protein
MEQILEHLLAGQEQMKAILKAVHEEMKPEMKVHQER